MEWFNASTVRFGAQLLLRCAHVTRIVELIDPDAMLASPEFGVIQDFVRSTGRTQIGWHYLTDLIWIYRQALTWPAGARVLDAGGGGGPTQFLLLEMGFDVTNIDLRLPGLRAPYVWRYQAKRFQLASHQPTSYSEHLSHRLTPSKARVWQRMLGTWPIRRVRNARYGPTHDGWRRRARIVGSTAPGRLQWIVGNLCDMPEIADASFDAVVSLSAFEHIPIELLDAAVRELSRVLKPEARWAVTTSATERAESWFHEPSKGWCYSIADLGRYFAAANLGTAQPGAMLEQYRRCGYLRRNMAVFYRLSGNNGMPWGIWDPTYVPVGIRT